MLKPGLYEQIINKEIDKELEQIPEACKNQDKIDKAEASRVLSSYVSEILKQKMDEIYDEGGSDALEKQIQYANQVIQIAGGNIEAECNNSLHVS